MTSEKKRVQKFHTDDSSLPRSGSCFWLVEAYFQPIKSPTQIWLVIRHQYGNSALLFQASFRGKSLKVGCFLRLDFQTYIKLSLSFLPVDHTSYVLNKVCSSHCVLSPPPALSWSLFLSLLFYPSIFRLWGVFRRFGPIRTVVSSGHK